MRGVSPLLIAALEPYAALSHQRFLEELARHSRHSIELHTLPARAWKWRMRTASLHYAELLAARPPYDLYLVSDYLALAELRALLSGAQRDVPAVVTFHENQLTYPLQPGERRDHHFALTHLFSGLCAGAILFHSEYHRSSFLAALGELLRHVPDVDMRPALETFAARSSVLPLGTELSVPAGRADERDQPPLLLWNHRWEYDKDPEAFVAALDALARRGVPFRVAVLGQSFRQRPAAFEGLAERLGPRLVAQGFAPPARYHATLARAALVVSTARHEFFGLGTLEALRCGALPVLPEALAYPELLPPGLRRAPWLYAPDAPGEPPRALVAALERALELCRGPEGQAARRALEAWTADFAWSRLAPRYDRILEETALHAPQPAIPGPTGWK